jgi:hypothetical protein
MTDHNDEIHVRRREGVPWWGWLIALILIALLVWFLLSMNTNPGGTPPPTSPGSSPSLQLPSASELPTGSPGEMTSPEASPTAS